MDGWMDGWVVFEAGKENEDVHGCLDHFLL